MGTSAGRKCCKCPPFVDVNTDSVKQHPAQDGAVGICKKRWFQWDTALQTVAAWPAPGEAPWVRWRDSLQSLSFVESTVILLGALFSCVTRRAGIEPRDHQGNGRTLVSSVFLLPCRAPCTMQLPALGSKTLGGQLSAPARGHVLFPSRAELRSMGEEDFPPKFSKSGFSFASWVLSPKSWDIW